MGELQRQRSNGGWASSSQRKGRITFSEEIRIDVDLA
jgi:hypothetical protein